MKKRDLSLLVVTGIAAAAFGQFSTIQPIESTEHGLFMDNEPSVIVDLDGDGDLDMASCSGEGVGMWRNDGQGGYAPTVLIDNTVYTGYATLMEAVDFDQDGDLDLLVAENYTRLFLYANNGNASFQPAAVLMPALGDLRDLVVAELTGDTYPDVLLSDYWGDSLWVMPNVSGTGLGPRITVSTGPGSITDLHVDDLDDDGDNDVFFGSYAQAGCHWSEQTAPGAFAPPVILFPFDVEILDMNTADLDLDGDLDMLVGGFNRSFWYANDGSGQFGPADTLQFTSNSANYYGHLVADLDGDGDLDVVPVDYSLSHPDRFVNDGAGNFTNAGPLVGASVYQLAAADMDGDADADLVQTTRNAIWWANDGAGNLGGSTFLAGGLTTPSSVAVADINGDGIKDVLATGYPGRLAVWWGLGGGGAFSGQVVLLDTVDNPKDLAVGDLDGDGDIDVTTIQSRTIRTFLNTGNGSLIVGQAVINNTSTINGAQLGDVDGDGDLDLVTAEYNPSQVRRWTNNGSGTFINPSQIAVVASPDDIDLCDVDGDGDLDAVFSYGSSPSQFVWMANNGAGQFGTPQVFFTSTGNGGNSCAVTFDADGDGDNELVSASWEGLILFPGTGGGGLGPGVGIYPDYFDETDLVATDLDNDGDVDLAMADKSGGGAVYTLNDGSGAFGYPVPFGSNSLAGLASELAVADLDGDGDKDILVGNMNTVPYSVGASRNYFNSFYHIEGSIFHDQDADGVHDVSEVPLPFVQLAVDPANGAAVTDTGGAYVFYCDTGLFSVGVNFPNAWWGLTTDSAAYHPHITTIDPVSTGNDFGFAVTVDTTLLVPSVVGTQWPCGDTTTVWVNVMNLGTSNPSGSVCLTLDTLYTFVASVPPPSSAVGNTYCWDYSALGFYSSTTVQLEVVLPDPSSMGQPFTNSLLAISEDALGMPEDTFAYAWSGTVTCGYDPNDKRVDPPGYGDAGAVALATPQLDYTIRFQNTGSAPAIDVVLSDVLDESLDLNTFQVLGHSHAPTLISIGADRELVVRFEGIQLPDSGADFTGSQGYFRFRMGLLPGQAHLTEITNTANIYFDLNPAVVTNTTLTTLVDCDLATATIVPEGWQALHASDGDAYQWYLNGVPLAGEIGQLLFFAANGSYTCQVTTVLGCVVMTDPVVITTASVPDVQLPRCVLMPNPMSSTARLVFNGALAEGDRLELLDAGGRTIRTFGAGGGSEVAIDRQGLESGIYLVRLVRGGVTVSSVRMAVAD